MSKKKQRPRFITLQDPTLYFNRELSWLQFNWRVLEEALDQRNPLLERVKFLAIFASNLDEFFMIRVSGLRKQLAAGVFGASPDGMTPAEQLAAIRQVLSSHLAIQMQCWYEDLIPQLAAQHIHILNYENLKRKQRKLLRRYFEREIFPILTPMAFDPGHPFPHISNLSINLAVVVSGPHLGERFARVKIPGFYPRLLHIPEEASGASTPTPPPGTGHANNFVWIEDVVRANLAMLFPGLTVVEAHPFRVTRDADIEIEEDEASDLLATIEERVGLREFGQVVRLEVDHGMPKRIRDTLTANLQLAPYQVYTSEGPIGLADVRQMLDIERPDLKDTPFIPTVPHILSEEPDIFTALRKTNVLLYHPYDSFTPVLDFIHAAARDPHVLAIKQTLYRVGPNAPVVDALLEARENGKQVAVLVELKARFDEENNIVWAKALEQAGVHVVYGLVGLKTHAKLCLVVRRDSYGITRYVHLSTGNYNSVTARTYGDIGYFTADPDITADVSDLFNALTGYSRKVKYRKIIVAPGEMRPQLLFRIKREIKHHRKHGNGYIAFKMNSLVDPACIQALYQASQAGVKVELQIRGICCLRPGVPGVSDNIRVTSIVGRFLEHARLFYFRNNGDEELWLGSADLMPRNLDRRVELLFPIESPVQREVLLHYIFETHLRDNVAARELLPDGSYQRLQPLKDESPLHSQQWLIDHRGIWERSN